MTQLPTGTVTFLFSDIEGSTRLLQRHRDRYADLLETHRQLLRESFARHGGIELGTEGDSFFVVFPSAAGALIAAADAQRALHEHRWPEGAAVSVRMGVLTGEAQLESGSYIGLDVHRAARLAAAAHGGQVLVAEQTRTLVAASLRDGLQLRDLGEHHLKDLDAPERIFQLVVPGLEDQFPPLRTSDSMARDLPTPMTSFLGRDDEIADVTALLERARLVTLTGPGGTGKTRLSLEIGRRVRDRYPDGVHFVTLASIREVDLVVPTVAAELGLADRGGRSPMERVEEHLRGRRVLLILDNFEQLLSAAVEVATLLAAAGGLAALVTSRRPLKLYGEHEYPVPPLGLPPPGAPAADPEALAGHEAIALFVERAGAASPTFRLTMENGPVVADICARLDGLPLAIELAAARVKLLTPQAILARLGHRLSLGGGGRDLPERQQTLRDAIAWSYELLDEADRRLFAGLSVFVGGASLEAAEQVLAAATSGDVLEGLASLVDNSLLGQRGGTSDEPRFAMLETIREYADERLAETGRRDELQRRHAEYFVVLAERARPMMLGPRAREWLDLLDEEHDNLRAALTSAARSGETEIALRLVAALWRFWQRRGYLVEGLDRARAALALPGAEANQALRADALEAAGGLAYWQADALTTRALYEEALALRRQVGDERAIAEALYNLSFSYTWLSATDPAANADPERALQLLEEARALFARAGDNAGVAKSLWGIATSEFWTRRIDASSAHTAEAMELARGTGDPFLLGWVLYLRALTSLATGDLAAARPALSEALEIFSEAGDVSADTLVLDGFAALALKSGDRERAARISGAVASLEARSGTGLNPMNRAIIGFDPEELRRDPALAQALKEGAEMDLAALVSYAVGDRSQSATRH